MNYLLTGFLMLASISTLASVTDPFVAKAVYSNVPTVSREIRLKFIEDYVGGRLDTIEGHKKNLHIEAQKALLALSQEIESKHLRVLDARIENCKYFLHSNEHDADGDPISSCKVTVTFF